MNPILLAKSTQAIAQRDDCAPTQREKELPQQLLNELGRALVALDGRLTHDQVAS